MFALQVNKNQIRVMKSEPMTSGSQNVYPVYFNFSEEWQNLERVAVFATDVGPDGPIEQTVYNQILNEENRCFIPWEVNVLHNKHVFVGVFGTMDGNVVLPTVWVDLGNVTLGVTTGLEIEPPTPTLWEQILRELNSIKGQLGSGSTQEIPLSVLEYSNIDDGFQFISGGYLPKVFLFDHVTLKVYEEKARGLSSVYFNNEIVYVRREEEESALYVTTMLGVTYKFSYEPDDYKFVNLEIVDYEPKSVETFPTIKNQVVNNINVLDELETSFPFCVHLINSSLGGFFVNDLVWVNKSNNKLAISTIDGAKIKMNIDPESGELFLESLVRIDDRVDHLEGVVDILIGRPTPENGVSPTVEVTPIENGNRVTITDATGSKSFDIFNGQQGLQGVQGVKGEKGEPFSISKVYSSVDEMNADYPTNDVSIGQFVVIDTGNVEDEDNAKLFIKGQTSYTFITDLSGAKGIQGPPGTQGEQGIEGPSGQNGVSPTVSVTEIDGGHRVSITDVNGTQTFDVMDGQSINTPSSNSFEVINATVGSIMAWTDPDNIPQGWHICDGTENTYDLRGKFILGASEDHAVGETGGSEEVKLTVEQMPTHNHQFYAKGDTGSTYSNTVQFLDYSAAPPKTINSTTKGSSQPHPNMPPYVTLIFIQKIGVTPTDYVTEERMEEYVDDAINNIPPSSGVPTGSITMWCGPTAPDEWVLCDGMLYNISDYPALANTIKAQYGNWNYFGGDGTTTFAVPDMRGRFPLGSSSSHAMGSTGGSEEVKLTVKQMPSHNHTTLVYNTSGNTTGGSKFVGTSGSTVYTSSTGDGYPHPNMPPYLTLSFIIKL